MKTVILCGGQGTRLREETEFKPKPLVPIGNMPILWHIMKIYSHYGHKEFILPLGYKGSMIKEYFMNFNWMANNFTLDMMKKRVTIHEDHKIEDWKLHFVSTGKESKTARRLHKVRDLLKSEEYFMLSYGDGIANVDIDKLIAHHKKLGKIVTITGICTSSKFGVLDIKDDIITNFSEKPFCDNDFINGGFFVCDKRFLDYVDGSDVMIVEDTLPKLAKMGEVAVYKHTGYWACMDTYRDYIKLNKEWKENPGWKVWDK